MTDVVRDNIVKEAATMESAALDAKMEKHFRSHPELKGGRDFRMNTMRYQVVGQHVSEQFDDTFTEAPDSPSWWASNFCENCGLRKSLCICIRRGE